LSTFEQELLSIIGDKDAPFTDIRVAIRRCWHYAFPSGDLRLWDGIGKLITVGDVEWLGTTDGSGVNHHTTPAIFDTRDGASPQYTFGLPYLDAATFETFKNHVVEVKGTILKCYNVLVYPHEGLRPGSTLRFDSKFVLKGAEFEQSLTDLGNGSYQRTLRATAYARSTEEGRSRFPGGTYTDTIQRARAARLGVDSDSGCSFMAQNARRTYIVGG